MRVETKKANPSEPPATFVNVAESEGEGGSIVAAATAIALASVPAVPLENQRSRCNIVIVMVGAMRNWVAKTKAMCVAFMGLSRVDAHSRIGTDRPTRKKRNATVDRMTVFDGIKIGIRYPSAQEPTRLHTGDSRLTFRDVENILSAVWVAN